VARYDGTEFTLFRKKDGLSSNNVVRIKEDSHGRIWFIHINATLNYYQDGIIYTPETAPFLDSLESREFFRDFVEDSAGTLYFYYNYHRDIYALSPDNTVRKSKLPSYRIPGIGTAEFVESMIVRYLSFGADGRVYFWTGAGMYSAGHIGDSLVKVEGIPNFRAAYPVPSGSVYAFVTDGGNKPVYRLIRMNDEHSIDEKFKPLTINTYFISSIVEDKDGVVWISTFDQGVICYQDGQIIHHYDIREAQAIIQDHEENIWITTLNDGVYKINPYLHRRLHRHYEGSLFGGLGIQALSHLNYSGVWMTNGQKVFQLTENGINTLTIGDRGQAYNQLIQPGPGSLIVGEVGTNFSALSGIYRVPGTATLKYGGIGQSEVAFRKLMTNASGDQIVTWSFFTLIRIQSARLFNQVQYNDLGERIHFAYYDQNGDLNVVGKQVYHYRNDSLVKNDLLAGLSGIAITDYLILDDHAELFNLDGDSIVILSGGKFLNLTHAWNYPTDLQVRFLEYDKPYLFVGTNRNIFLCKEPLGLLDGKKVELDPLEVNFRNIHDMLLEGHDLYIASDDGLTVMNIHDILRQQSSSPIPYFLTVTVDDEPGQLQDGWLVLKGAKRIQIRFGSINYSGSPVTYSYMLDGLDQEWHIANGRDVLYESLPMGEYTFRLRALKPTSLWSPSISYNIRVERTIWQHPLFMIFITALAAGAIMLFILWRKNVQMRKKDVEHQLVLLEQRALQSMMNPHFIFNALGSIQNYLLQSKPREAGLYLARFARLIRNNLKSTNSATINLLEEVTRLKDYLDLEKLRMEDKFDYVVTLDEHLDAARTRIPSMIIQTFVENSIWHGMAFPESKGMIRISFVRLDDRSLKAIIEDNGIGIKKADAVNAKNGDHLNMGFSVTRKRLELMSAKFSIETSLEIDEPAPGTENPGTRITLIVPYFIGTEDF